MIRDLGEKIPENSVRVHKDIFYGFVIDYILYDRIAS